MELFVIHRYTGIDPVYERVPNEEKLRKKLQKKINKRKRLSGSSANKKCDAIPLIDLESNNIIGNDFKDSEVVEPKKKRQKCIDENNVLKNEPTEFLENTESPDAFTKKKKKSQEPDAENVGPEENATTDLSENVNENETQNAGFTILGDLYMSKKQKVKRKLPNWLANPSVVSVDLKNLTQTVDSMPELDKIFVDVLKENNITHFFPVQSQIIPWLIKSAERPDKYWANDICVSAPTGSGKTLAFVLPILQILNKRIIPKIRALVVLPVQDLANQVFDVFQTYSKPTNLNVLLLTKLRPFKEEQSLICKSDNMGKFRTLVDIIVTTPGRLVDHLTNTKGLCLDELRYLVIDEADRVMENVQNNWLYHLNKHINSECNKSYQVPVVSYHTMNNRRRPPNKLLFSATLSQDPEKLQELGLFQPKLFTSIVKSNDSQENDQKDETRFIGKYTTPAELTEYYVNTSKAMKPVMLHHLIKTKSWKNVLCFVNSAEATSRLSYVLKALGGKDIKIGKLSSNLTIKGRNAVLKKFSMGVINVLISSDALARGIDIPSVQCVVSYGAPKYIKTYIHRIGRTGRAGKQGISVALLTPKERSRFQKMIETAGKTSVKVLDVPESELEQYRRSYGRALRSLGTLLEKKKQKRISHLKIKKNLQLRASKGKLKKNKAQNS